MPTYHPPHIFLCVPQKKIIEFGERLSERAEERKKEGMEAREEAMSRSLLFPGWTLFLIPLPRLLLLLLLLLFVGYLGGAGVRGVLSEVEREN